MSKSKYIKNRKNGRMLGRTGFGKDSVPEASKLAESTWSTTSSAIKDSSEVAKAWDALESIRAAVALGATIPAIKGTVLYKASVYFEEREFGDLSTVGDPEVFGYERFANEILLGVYASEETAYDVVAAYLLSNFKHERWLDGTKEKYIRRSTGENLYEESKFSLWAEGKTSREIVGYFRAEKDSNSVKIEEMVVGQDVNLYERYLI